jgi:hypothetical protein
MDDAVREVASAILGLGPEVDEYHYDAELVGAALQNQLDGLAAEDKDGLAMVTRAAAVLGLAPAPGGSVPHSRIDEDVLIGSHVAANIDALRQLGVASLLSVSARHPPLLEVLMEGVPCHHIPWPDGGVAAPRPKTADLDEVVRWISAAAKPVLVCCHSGAALSAAAACAHLMARHAWGFERAHAALREKVFRATTIPDILKKVCVASQILTTPPPGRWLPAHGRACGVPTRVPRAALGGCARPACARRHAVVAD